jgi:RNA polymerase sigma factor (sigma-70 family)
MSNANKIDKKNFELFKKFEEDRTDIVTRNFIVENNRGLVAHIIKKYYAFKFITPDLREELMQEGVMSLISAINKYDYTKGFKFSTYAAWWIKQSINHFLLNVNPLIRVPGHIRTAQSKLVKKMKSMGVESDFSSIVASDYDIPVKTLNSIKNATNVKKIVYFNQPIKSSNGEKSTYGDLIESEKSTGKEQNIDNTNLLESVKRSLSTMTAKRKLILLLRFGVINEEDVSDIIKTYE